jgi:hypothetical protein
MPEELSDRMQEACESLVAIAEGLGYGQEARTALVELLTGDRDDEREHLEVELLRDCRPIFDGRDKLSDAQLVDALRVNGNGWDEYYDRGLKKRDVAALLKPYGVHSTSVRIEGQVKRGYRRDDFVDAWSRCLGDETDVTDVTAPMEKPL